MNFVNMRAHSPGRREHFLPKVLNREPTASLLEGEVRDMAKRAKEKARELLAMEAPRVLSQEQEEAMERVLKRAAGR